MVEQLLAIVVGTFISEDLTAIATGLLISERRISPPAAIAACVFGIYIGDLALWLTGRLLGRRVLARTRVRGVLASRSVEGFTNWFERRAAAAILGSRFLPGTRLPFYLLCGACRTSFVTFASWSFVAVALWTPALVLATVAIGPQASQMLASWLALGRGATWAAALIGVIAWRLGVRLLSRRGRQQMIAAISRIWRWEFWPMWLFYFPVTLWIGWLAIRYRGCRTFTVANPGIPDGGVVGESKFDILSQLPTRWTIPSAVVEPGTTAARVRALRELIAKRGWTLPLVLKPDVGQRGTGVRLAVTMREAADYFERATDRVLVQPFHPGPHEAGVFYYRIPTDERGRILCITEKAFPLVVGDGHSTLEDLIWSHPRYRMQARIFLDRLGLRRVDVPAAGTRVPLGIAGNHAQGAMFTDGRDLITPELEARIDAIARTYPGFFIGRFDIRYSDRAEFMAGQDLAIVELNGATAECTNIYDPASSLLSAYRQLFEQWRLVYEIGAINRRAGHRVTATRRFVGLLRAHFAAPNPFPVSD